MLVQNVKPIFLPFSGLFPQNLLNNPFFSHRLEMALSHTELFYIYICPLYSPPLMSPVRPKQVHV